MKPSRSTYRTTEPVSNPDELPTAQKLAQHPRWEWRDGVLIGGDGELAGWRAMLVEPWGNTFTRDGQSWAVSASRLPALALVPDLADDATAGIVLGMVRAWGEANDHYRVDLCICRHPDSGPEPTASVSVGHWRGMGPCIEGTGPTLGDAAGACLLACWARDVAESTETDRSER